MHMTTHSGNDCSPETLVVQEVKEFATGDCIEESSFSYTYDCTTWQQGSGEGGGEEEEIYHDHTSRKQKGTGEKRQNESRDFQRCVFLERCGFGGLSRGGFHVLTIMQMQPFLEHCGQHICMYVLKI
jgi:hypothetical protein